MDNFVLILIGLAFAGFIFGLAGKSRAVKKNSIKKSELYQKLTIVSLILMFVFAIVYRFIL